MANFSAPQIQNDLIYSLPHLYIAGVNISIASTTILALAPGQVRDANDNLDMPISFPDANNNINPAILFQNYQQPIYINSAVVGANGIDAGALAASTQYAIYLIGDSRGYNLVAGIITLASNAAPVIPFGYDSYRLMGFIETDGSEHFVYATHEPQTMQNALSYYLQPPISVLSAGNATTFTGVDCNSAVPAGTLPNVILYLLVTFIPAAAGDTVVFRPTGSAATTGLVTITGLVANVAQTQYIQIIAGVNGSSHTSFDYEVTASGDAVTVLVAGWTGAPHQAYPT